jgi:Bacterial regulatory helix-turn-helix protein, lysR family
VTAVELAALQHLELEVESGSFTKAAVELGVNTSTLSRHITALEDELWRHFSSADEPAFSLRLVKPSRLLKCSEHSPISNP